MAITLNGTTGINTPVLNAGNIVGQVCFFAMQIAPAGFLACDGATVSRSTYADLFAAIGTTYGVGDGSTTFKLPDLRGDFIRGWDGGRGVDTGRVFGSFQNEEVKEHTHMVLNSTSTAISAGSSGRLGGNLNNSSGSGRPSEAFGGTETRPRNVALLPCIKY